MHKVVVLNNVLIHLLGKGSVASVAPVGVAARCNSDAKGIVVSVNAVEVVWVVVVDEACSRSLPFAVGIQIARAKNGSSYVVAVVALAWAAKILGHAPFKVNVGLYVSVVAMANYNARAPVVASAGIRHSYGVGAVVFDACAILCFARSLLGLQVLNVSKSRHLVNLVGTQQHADSVGAGFDYLTDF